MFIASILDFLTNLNTQVFDLARIIYFVAVYVALQFQFVNSFLSLFYIAFYLQDMQLLKDVSLIQFFYIFFYWCLYRCKRLGYQTVLHFLSFGYFR